MQFPALEAWFQNRGWKAADFQREVWRLMAEGKSGLLHSSTGSGKTLAVWMGLLADPPKGEGIKALWITPLRSLASDTLISLHEPARDLGVDWKIELRTGDTSSHTKQKQLKELPDALITTPESLTLLLSMRAADRIFQNLELIVVDEWHELVGTKRGVQAELALARVRRMKPECRVWGLSATLGNTAQAAAILAPGLDPVLVRGETEKEIIIDALLPDSIERFPWAGHIGLKMIDRVIAEIDQVESCLLFTNTRGQAEMWHQAILNAAPPWVEQVALHHGSMDQEVRAHAEQGLKAGELRAVVCTSSLDLGVDFSPVERVFQIGSPKGVARLLQRAGRSGHRPGVPSRVTCVPTHAWELLDIAAVRQAAHMKRIEAKPPILNPLDVLAQHLVSMALADGFKEEELLAEVRTSFAYQDLTDQEWQWALDFVTRGGETLRAYPEFRKVIYRDGKYVVEDKRIATRHRTNIGTIVSDPAIKVAFLNGSNLGTIEEGFVAKMKRGDRFVFAGKTLEFVRIKDTTCFVRKAKPGKGLVPSWSGGRMPLTTELAFTAREKLGEIKQGVIDGPELQLAAPLLSIQADWSGIPDQDELLIEQVESREGHHLFFFPIEGRLVHEGLAALTAYRLSRRQPILFSIACNDYGFELLSDQKIEFGEEEARMAFSTENLAEDILHSLNSSELARRQFREIARIAGLIFSGYPGQQRSARQIQTSSGLLFDVFSKYDPGHPLLKQADREVLDKHLEQTRLLACLERLSRSRFLFTEPARPTPIAFPILVDRLRETVGSESFSDRVQRLVTALEAEAG